MEKSALAQEKVWFDKPSYDKAERLYFERMAKVVSHKIMENCSLKSEVSLTNNCKDNSFLDNNSLKKSKSRKSKKNESLISKNITNDIQNAKCQAKAPKTHNNINKLNIQKEKNVKQQKSNHAENVLQEKKNEADTRNRDIKQNDDTKKVIENVTPLKRNTQQLPIQGNQQTTSPILFTGGSLANEVAKARQHIKQSLQCMDDIATVVNFISPSDDKKDVINFSVFQELKNVVENLGERVKYLEDKIQPLLAAVPPIAVCPAKPQPDSKPAQGKTDDDDDIDLFGSDSEGEDADAAKLREERLAAYAAKNAKKPALIAKSNIILDVKPWDDETDMKAMEDMVRKVETDGLLWGASKLVPLAFGIHKLQISCVVEDDKVSVDWLTEQIQEIKDYVQSVDIAAFNKV